MTEVYTKRTQKDTLSNRQYGLFKPYKGIQSRVQVSSAAFFIFSKNRINKDSERF